MQFTEAGVSCPFEVTYDSPSLDVAMQVFNVTSGTPVFVARIPMLNVIGNTYFASFTPLPAHQYVINKAVYTDGTYTTISPDYSQGSESLRSDDLAGLFLNAVLSSYQIGGSVGKAIQMAANGGSGGSPQLAGVVLQARILTPTLIGIIETPENIGGCP